MAEDIRVQFAAVPVGELTGVSESWYAIASQRRLQHPAVAQILESGGDVLARTAKPNHPN
jgi:LysR family transcriptional activator of nhaA